MNDERHRVSLRSRAKLAYAGLFAIGSVHVIAAGASSWLLVLIARLQAGEPVSDDQLGSIVRLSEQLETAYWVGLTVAATTFIIWFYRAYKNLVGMRSMERGAGAAVFCWFIPFANFIMPYSIAAEIWTGSAPNPMDENPSRGIGLVRLWWAAWVVSGLLGTILLSRAGEPATIDEVQVLQYKAITINLLRVITAVFAALVIKRITERQQASVIAPARVVVAD